jgi:hypothetical protein
MKSCIRFLLVLTALSASTPAFAAVVSRDWKTPGDGLLTYDDVNQREWLDLSQTVLDSQFPGNDREAKYQYVIGQTGAGGFFEGFTPANVADVMMLAASAGIDTSTLNYNVNALATLSLGELLTFTRLFPAGKESSGLLDEVNARFVRRRADIGFDFNSLAGLRITLEIDRLLSPPPGVFLYRAIPEPSAIFQAVIGMVIIASSRARRNR